MRPGAVHSLVSAPAVYLSIIYQLYHADPSHVSQPWAGTTGAARWKFDSLLLRVSEWKLDCSMDTALAPTELHPSSILSGLCAAGPSEPMVDSRPVSELGRCL